jgi:hypothetical protein
LEESRKKLMAGTRDMRNHEKIWTVEPSRLWTVDLTRFQSFSDHNMKSRDSSSQESRSCEMRNVKNFGVRDLECQNTSS